jgi:microcystin-dependent protein
MDAFQPGMLVPWTGAAGGPYPAGWLLCDGSEYEMSAYPELHAVVGTMYCPGPCSSVTKFAVPDMRGRTVVHKGGTALNTAIATVVGAETHTFHVHVGTGGAPSPGPFVACNANPPFSGLQYNSLGSVSCGQQFINEYWTGLSTNYDTTFGIYPPASAAHSHSFTTGGAGSGGAHNNIQPSMVMQYLIKT